MPAVSIILPTYDRLPYLKEAVASVASQTFGDWELIVVDDGSTDGTIEWLESLDDQRLVIVGRPHSGNRSAVRNAGIARARASLVAFLDSDDRWAPEKLKRQLAHHAANPSHRWSYTGRTMVDAHGTRMPDALFTAWQAHSGSIVERILTLEVNIALPSVMVERTLLVDAGGFNESFSVAQDFELWLRLAERSPCGCVDAPLVDIRKHRGGDRYWPELCLAFSSMFRRFAERTADPALRELARTRAAYHAIDASDQLSLAGQWREARGALALAFRLRPLAPFSYRAAVRMARRRVIAGVQRSNRPSR